MKKRKRLAERGPAQLEGRTLLVGLGAQKAGTTWVSTYLGANPQIFVPILGGEVHYFDAIHRPETFAYRQRRNIDIALRFTMALRTEETLNRKKWVRLLESVDRMRMIGDPKYGYHGFFADRVRDERVFCDITPSYMALDAAAFDAILKSHTDVRLFLIMRDPVEQFWSGLRMRQKKNPGFDATTRFSDALANENTFALSDYRRTILEVEKVVDPSRIRYFFFEKLFTDEAVAELMAFIGLEPQPANFGKVVNQGIPVEMPDAYRAEALARLRPVYDFVFQRFGNAVPEQWHRTAGAR